MLDRINPATEAAISSAANKATIAGAGTTFFSGIASNDIGILIGVVLGLGGFVVNFIFRLRQDRRNAELHRRHMQKLDTRPAPICEDENETDR